MSSRGCPLRRRRRQRASRSGGSQLQLARDQRGRPLSPRRRRPSGSKRQPRWTHRTRHAASRSLEAASTRCARLTLSPVSEGRWSPFSRNESTGRHAAQLAVHCMAQCFTAQPGGRSATKNIGIVPRDWPQGWSFQLAAKLPLSSARHLCCWRAFLLSSVRCRSMFRFGSCLRACPLIRTDSCAVSIVATPLSWLQGL